jgi:hypothetical protein
MSDLESVQPCPIKIMDPVLIKIRADEKVIKNTKTGKVTMVVNSLSAKSVLTGEKLVATYSIST